MIKLGVLSLATIFFIACSNPKHDLLITNVNVIDVVTGEVLPSRTVAIDGDEITAIYTKTIKARKNTVLVDGTGKYLIPGLWDMHAHYHWYPRDNDLLLIPNGVLGVRDPWGDPQQAKRLRVENQKGMYHGVEIFTSGSLIDSAPSRWGSSEAETEEQARALVNCQIDQGVDFVKPYSGLTKEVYLALMDEANRRGVMAAGHVPNSVTLEEAVAAGHRIDDHLYGLENIFIDTEQIDSVRLLREQKKWSESYVFIRNNRDSLLAQNRLEHLKEEDIWFCPTYVSLFGVLKLFKEKMESDPRNEYVSVIERHHGGSPDDGWLENMMYKTSKPDSIKFHEDQLYVLEQENYIKMLIQSGSKILAGTDYIIPYVYAGFSLQEELQIFVRLGMTPLQALQTATINPAQFMKNDKIGEVKAGKSANLVLLNANPLEDIHHAQDIYAVVLRGKHLDRDHLDGMLQKAKNLANAKHLHEWFAPRMEADGIESAIQTFLNNRESVEEEFPVRWNMLLSTGWRFFMEDKKAEAKAMAALTIELYSDFVYAVAFAGEIFKYCGDKEQARTAFQKALEVYPCYNIVERWIKELDEPLAFGQKYKQKEPLYLAARIPCMYHNH
ncbi:MAG: amidohydrolase family protein [Cecembia sp.]